MDKHNILITGGTGYLGSNLVALLVKKGYKITVLIRKSSNLSRLEKLKYKIDFINIDELESVFLTKRINGIIHTAACYGRKNEQLEEIIEANLLLPIKLLKYACEFNIDFFINTDTSLPKEINAYSLSKSHFKDWLKGHSGNFKVINIVPEYFYGPNDDETKFITNVINKLVSNSEAIDFSSGTQLRDFIYIDDIVNAYEFILNNLDKISTFTDIPIGTSNTISIRNLVTIIKQKLNNNITKLNFGKLPDRKGDVIESFADITILKSFGWTPKVNVEEGVQKIIELQKN